MALLDAFGTNVFYHEYFLNFVGLRIPARMTIIVLSGESESKRKLFVHSPSFLTPELRSVIDDLGEVSYLIAPNILHHVNLQQWVLSYPNAALYGAPFLPERRPDLTFKILTDTPPNEWKNEIDQICTKGSHSFCEVIFYHLESKTLITTDTVENFDPLNPYPGMVFTWGQKLMLRMFFEKEWPQPAPEFTYSITDPVECRQSLYKVLEWDFEKVIISHGYNVVEDKGVKAKEVIKESWDRFLSKKENEWRITTKIHVIFLRMELPNPDPISKKPLPDPVYATVNHE